MEVGIATILFARLGPIVSFPVLNITKWGLGANKNTLLLLLCTVCSLEMTCFYFMSKKLKAKKQG